MKLEYTTQVSAPTDPEEWARTDETLIRPVSPGAALVRLSQAIGGLRRHEPIAGQLADATSGQLNAARDALSQALENGEPSAVSAALTSAQTALYQLYAELGGPLLKGAEAEAGAAEAAATEVAATRVAHLNALGFPDPRDVDLRPVDVAGVIPTFALIRTQAGGHQVVTTLHFQEAHNATAYWLHEVRYFESTLTGEAERAEDPLIESFAPLFSRVRLALGTRHLRIMARNQRASVISDEFTIEVPDLRV